MLEFPAWLARLADLEQRGAQPKAVADMNIGFDHPARDDVLAERRVAAEHFVAAQPFAPTGVMLARIVMDRHIGSAMVLGVGNHVALEPEAADRDRTCDGAFGDGAKLGAIERLRLADAERMNRGRASHGLRTVSALQSRTTPSAPSPV